MTFQECLNSYIKELGCSGKELAANSGISETVISRYRKGERLPASDSEYLKKLADGIVKTAIEKGRPDWESESVLQKLKETLAGELPVRTKHLWMPGRDRCRKVPELSLYTGSSLEEIAGSFAYLAGGDSDYAKHVDSTRAVESDTQEMITNPEDTSTTTSIVFAQEKAGYKGVWVPFDDGFQLYLPTDWNTYELSEEEINQGLLYAAGDTSGSDTAPAVSVVWAKNDGAENIEELASEIRQAGYPVDDIVSINGIPCVSYRVEDGDCSAIMFFHPTDQQYILCITATQYTANVDMICSILTSLSLTAS